MGALKASTLVRNLACLLVIAGVLGGCDDGRTKYAVGGTVAGLTGAGLVLAMNGTHDLPVAASGSFTFGKKLPSGATYSISVRLHPVGQGCVVTSGSGVISAAAIVDVSVTCSTADLLTLSSFAPADGASGVARSVIPEFVFSAPLGAATANPANITLQSAAGSHTVIPGVTGNRLTVTPAGKLLPLAIYTLTVGAGVRGDRGETLADAVTTTFSTPDGAWQVREPRMPDPTQGSLGPQIAVAGNGSAMAMWGQFDGTWWSNYTPGVGWGVAQRLGTASTGYGSPPRELAMDAHGNAMAVWQISEYHNCGDSGSCSRKSLVVRRFTPDDGWGKAHEISAVVSNDSMQVKLAMNAAGNAFVVWSRGDDSERNIWVRRYVVGDGWGSARRLDIGGDQSSYPAVAMNEHGDAIAVWQEMDGSQFGIWSNRYTTGPGWGAAVSLQADTMSIDSEPQVALDASGNAVAVWQERASTQHSIWSNRYLAGAGWGTNEMIDSPAVAYSRTSQIAMDAQGNAVAVWERFDPAGAAGPRVSIWSNRYVANVGWGAATLIETDDTGHADSPYVATDARGNALAVWIQRDATTRYDLWSNRYVAGSGWGTPVLLETDDSGDAIGPQIAMDRSGDATVVWTLADAEGTRVFSARFE